MFVCIILIAYAVAADATVNSPCKTGTDCAKDECCVVVIPRKGKRFSLTPTCQKLGTENVNTDCYVKSHMSPTMTQYIDKCPCTPGHECVSTGIIEVPQGEHGKCTRQTHSGTQQVNHPCNSGADCADDECCVSNIRPLGKRSLFNSGHCEKLGTRHSHCLMRDAGHSGKPAHQMFQCPCSVGLKCVGIHQFDMPLGEIGQCH
ncbi:uncharacterized protein LOC121367275 [Gigantopelta aegis]|uniref:uncharacterized protein LOC121367275 n=1 Tax=Gigantopelta aegis TaxID=1735272 RepID=UPI001B8879C1|nr:uncharacterized protein LOC121367275 [Gigantopelta aegis]